MASIDKNSEVFRQIRDSVTRLQEFIKEEKTSSEKAQKADTEGKEDFYKADYSSFF